MEGTAGASAARLGGREGRNSRRPRFLGKRSGLGSWLFPRYLPPRAPLAPCFHPPEPSLRCRIAEQDPSRQPHPPAPPCSPSPPRWPSPPSPAPLPRRVPRVGRPARPPRGKRSPPPARARARQAPRSAPTAVGAPPTAVGAPPTAVAGARRAPAAAANGRDERRGGLLSSPRGGGRAVPRARPPARPPPAPVEVARRHQRTSTDSPHTVGPAALRLRRPALCSRDRLSRTSPVRAAPTPRAAPRGRPVVDRGPAQRASEREEALGTLTTPVVPPDIIIDAQT